MSTGEGMGEPPFGFSSGDGPGDGQAKTEHAPRAGPESGRAPLWFGGGHFDISQLGQIFSRLGDMFSGAGNVMAGGKQSGPVNYDLARQLASSSIGFVAPASQKT